MKHFPGKARLLLLPFLLAALFLTASPPLHAQVVERSKEADLLDRFVPKKVSGEDKERLLTKLAFAKGAEKIPEPDLLVRTFDSSTGFVVVKAILRPGVKHFSEVRWNMEADRRIYRTSVQQIQQVVLDRLDPADHNILHRLRMSEILILEVTEAGLLQLLADDDVEYVIHEELMERHLAQGIPQMSGIGPRSRYDGSGMTIAIIDDGVDYNHPMLGGAPLGENLKVIGGYDFADDDEDFLSADPDDSHGTAVAGIAAGDLPGEGESFGDYIGGVAPGARLVGLKVFSDGAPMTSPGAVDASLDWVLDNQNLDPENPIMVVNMSIGGGRFMSNCDTSRISTYNIVQALNAAGITVLSSSGNDGFCDSIGSPACLSNIISVGAVYDANLGSRAWCVSLDSCLPGIDPDFCGETTGAYRDTTTARDKVTAYSNTSATLLDVFAPSNDATTTDLVAPAGRNPDGNFTNNFGGTSAACPYAAGAVAVTQSAALALRGSYLSPSEVRTILVQTGDGVTDTKGGALEPGVTKPRINLQAIDDFLQPADPLLFINPDVVNIAVIRQEPSPEGTSATLVNPSFAPINYTLTLAQVSPGGEEEEVKEFGEWVSLSDISLTGVIDPNSSIPFNIIYSTEQLPVGLYEATLRVTGFWEREVENENGEGEGEVEMEIVEIEPFQTDIFLEVQATPARISLNIDNDLLNIVQIQLPDAMMGEAVYSVTTQTLQGRNIPGRIPFTLTNEGERVLEFSVFQRLSWLKLERPVLTPGGNGMEMVLDPSPWSITRVGPEETVTMFLHVDIEILPPGVYREAITFFSTDPSVRNNPSVLDLRLLISPQVGLMFY